MASLIFFEEISSLSHFIIFPLFLCIGHLGRLSYFSLLFFGTLHSNGFTFPFFLCLLLLLLSEKKLFVNCIVINMYQFSSVTKSCPTLCNPMNRSTPGLHVHRQLLESTQVHMSIESVMPSNHLILCRPLLLLPSIFPSIRVFSDESALCIRWAKYWSFSFNISPSNEHPGLISFRIDWLDLLAVQGTLKSSPTPQLKSINSSVLSFHYSPTLRSIHDHWKNHSLD